MKPGLPPLRTRLAAPIVLALAIAVSLGLSAGSGAHDGHQHTPVGRWFFWPDYTLDGRARNPIGPVPEPLPNPFGRLDAASPPLLLFGEAPTERAARLLPGEKIPRHAFSIELWLVDHVNRPVGALVTARGRRADDPPAWALGYRAGKAFFSVNAGAQPEPVVLETPARDGFKKYWRHLVATYDGHKTRLYLNGTRVAETEAAGTVELPPLPELEVAAYLANEPHMALANLVREVRLYDDDIGPAQVQARFAHLQRLVDEGLIHDDRFHFTAGPYLHQMTRTSVNIAWETDRAATGVVRFGRGMPYDREARVTGEARLQHLTLDGLDAQTTYFYELTATAPDGAEIRSGPLTFKTAVHPNSPFTFAVIGDTEARPHINDRIAKAIWGERPDFVVHVGDLTDGGQHHQKFEWNLEYFLGMNQLTSRVPLFPVPGNGESDLHWYLRFHALPPPGNRYAFRYGNAEFFMLDSNRPLGPGSEQYAWLDAALAASTARWRMVCHHHPVFSSDDDDYGDSFREASQLGDANPRSAVPLYERHGVDLVFYGHIHAYERTWPMTGGRVNAQSGVRYVQTGGAGGNLEDFTPTRNAFSGKVYRGHHYCLLSIHEGSLRFQMFDVEGRLRDAIELHK